jgi:hypothetical protein
MFAVATAGAATSLAFGPPGGGGALYYKLTGAELAAPGWPQKYGPRPPPSLSLSRFCHPSSSVCLFLTSTPAPSRRYFKYSVLVADPGELTRQLLPPLLPTHLSSLTSHLAYTLTHTHTHTHTRALSHLSSRIHTHTHTHTLSLSLSLSLSRARSLFRYQPRHACEDPS